MLQPSLSTSLDRPSTLHPSKFSSHASTDRLFSGNSTPSLRHVLAVSQRNIRRYRPKMAFNLHERLKAFDAPVAKPTHLSPLLSKHALQPISRPPSSYHSTDESRDSTRGSARSPNGYFTMNDSESLDQYLLKITGGEDGSLSDADDFVVVAEEPLLAADQTPDQGLDSAVAHANMLMNSRKLQNTADVLHYAVKCNNLSHWTVTSTSVRIQTLNFKIMEHILYRETILFNLTACVKLVDKRYWEYCVQRIRCVETEKSLHSEALVVMRNEVFALQNKLAVEMAHLRSLSLAILHSVRKMRRLVSMEVKLQSSISVYWKGQNYLKKIYHDCDFLSEYQTMRWWLGFPPNALMIPPTVHDPAAAWKQCSDQLLPQWLSLHRDKVSADRRVWRARRGTNMIAERKEVAETLLLSFEREEERRKSLHVGQTVVDKESAPVTSQPSSPTRVHLTRYTPSPFSLLPPRSRGQPKPQRTFEPWAQLRDYCAYSWGHVVPGKVAQDSGTSSPADGRGGSLSIDGGASTTSDASDNTTLQLYEQSAALAPFFWKNPDHNPYVVEAALGFAEIFPSVYLVPPLTAELRLLCLQAQAMLHSEYAELKQLGKLEQKVRKRYDEFLAKEARAADFVQMNDQAVAQRQATQERLMRLQEEDARSMKGVSVDCFLTSYMPPFASADLSLLLRTLQTSRSADQLATSAAIGEDVFSLTTTGSQVTTSQQEQPMSLASSQQLVPMQSFSVFTIETAPVEHPLRVRLQHKVDEQRRLVDATSAARPRALRSDRRSRREFNRLDARYFHRLAVQFQRLVRGFLARRRLQRRLAAERWQRLIITIQALVRGFIARLHTRRLLRAFKLETFLLRKDALRRFRASLTVTRALRRFINIQRLKRQEPLLFDRLDPAGRPITPWQSMSLLRRSLHQEQLEELKRHGRAAYKQLLALHGDDVPPTPTEFTRSGSRHSQYSRSASPLCTSASTKSMLALSEQGTPRSVADSRDEKQSDAQSVISVDSDEERLEQLNKDEMAKRKFLQMRAIELVKRVNAGRQRPDDLRRCRLLPVATHSKNGAKKPVLSRKRHTFLRVAHERAPSSLLDSTAAAYTPSPWRAQTLRHPDALPRHSSTASLSTVSSTLRVIESASSPHRRGGRGDGEDTNTLSSATRHSASDFATHLRSQEALKREREEKERTKFRAILQSYLS